MLEIERKAKIYLRSMDKLVMSCDNEEELRMLACAMMTSSIHILEQQIGINRTRKLLDATMEARYGEREGDRRAK